MKPATITTLASCLAGTAIAKPYSLTRRAPTSEIGSMTWRGPVFVDGPDVNLSGTAESIRAQQLELNPDYTPWDFEDYRNRMADLGFSSKEEFEADTAARLSAADSAASVSALKKRDSFECEPPGYSQVGNYPTQCIEGFLYLRDLGGNCGLPAGPSGCARVSCSNNCGVFGCNDNTFAIEVLCEQLAVDMDEISAECGVQYGDVVLSVVGQVFRDQVEPHWNTIVASQDC